MTNNFRIAYNPNDPTGGSERAYSVFNLNSFTDYSQLSSANETWHAYTTAFYNYLGVQDVTYRYDGSAVLASSDSNTAPTTSGYMGLSIGNIPAFYNDGGFFLWVGTNSMNHRDLISSWHEWTDPTNPSDYSGAAMCQELHP